ncbi:MAG: alpha/beta hydrolase [Planctomycetota bacterium]|nr:MAG: alpha/beta hydrolase [Planctomycetota bacterium]
MPAQPPSIAPAWWWRVLRSALSTLLLGYLIIAVLLWAMQERMIFIPTVGEAETTPDRWGLPFERHRLQTSDGESIDVWWMPHHKTGPVILFCHGNAGNLGHRIDTFRALSMQGWSVVSFDYRGYGTSSGRPSEHGLYLDAQRVWEFLVEDMGISAERIVLHGRSLGGGVAAYLAEQHQAAGLILESTFTSLPDVAAGLYPFLPVRLLARHHFPTVKRLPQIDMPLLVIHGKGDRSIPFHHGEALYAAAAEPKFFQALEGDHNAGFIYEADVWIGAIADFVHAVTQSENTP